MEHFHDHQPTHNWTSDQMAAHLRMDHGLDYRDGLLKGYLHLEHLKAHQGAALSTQPEEAPVPTEHTHHDDITTTHASWSYQQLARHLRDDHQEKVGYGAVKHDDLKAMHLGLHPEPDEKTQVKAVSTETDPHAEGKRIEAIDRIICTMAGIAFDSVWVLDESLSLRGVMRSTYGTQATRIWGALERGGLGFHEAIHQAVSQERALVEDMEEINNRLRGREAQLEAEVRGLQETLEETRDERQQALEAVMAAQGKAAELRSTLDAGRKALRTFIRALKLNPEYTEVPVHGIAQSLEDAVLGERVSTEQESPLKEASIRDLLTELLARIPEED
jgi:hypothetical protein